MNYAIIAAGEGSRLKKEGFCSVKPLVKVCGEYLIERLIRIFKNNNAESISIIINEESGELKSYLDSKDWGVKINLIVKSTPSSLHSFWNILNHTGINECCLTTVDTIFSERDFKDYISYFQSHKEVDALMGITEYIDDEKPLYIETDNDNNILAFKDTNIAGTENNLPFQKINIKKEFTNIKKESIEIKKEFTETPSYLNKVSAGIYCLRSKATEKAGECIKSGVSRMRNYQRSLVEADLKVKAFLFSKVIDIDHVEDIKKAEKLLKQFNTNILCVKRFKDYSPNSQDKDSQIINCVSESLRAEGYSVNIKDETEIDFDKEYFPYVISMARNPEVIKGFAKWEEKGAVVINSSKSCLNCWREKQINILQNNAVSIPQTVTVKTNQGITDTDFLNGSKAWWIKRGDFQTVEEIDVIKVSDLQTAEEILDNYRSRGINTAVISKNIDGDVVKFYGVRGTEFFYYTYPQKDKFNNPINTAQTRIKFNKEQFVSACQKAAECLDLDIYGGDAAIDTQGNFYIIDMNDFPSFSACKEVASENIVKRFLSKCNI